MAEDTPDPVPLPIPSQNITLTGAFNPDILVPHWALKHLTLPDSSVETLVDQGGRFLYRSGELFWKAERHRILVYGPTRFMGEFAAGLARTLPHTPLVAVGVNFQRMGRVEFGPNSPWHVKLENARIHQLLGGETSELALSHAVTREDEVRLTLKFVLPGGGPEAVLDFNYHLQVSAMASEGEERAELVRGHASRAEEFEADAQRISEVLLNE